MMGNYYGYGSMMDGGWGGWLFFCVGIIFLMLIVVGLVFAFLGLIRRRPPTRQAPPETPMDLLNRRYAAGEIDKQEYDQRKKDLSG